MNISDWYSRAKKEHFAICAFNVDNLEIFKAVVAAADKQKSPVILAFSPGEVGYFGLKNIVDLVINSREDYKIPIFLNLDHGKDAASCIEAVSIGSPSSQSSSGHSTLRDELVSSDSKRSSSFDSVHLDGSHLEIDENIKEAKKVVEAAHAKGLLVEGEIDKITGSSEVHTEDVDVSLFRNSYTDPAGAAKFVAETGVDIFAGLFGNLHGTFPNQPPLDFDLLKKIKEALPNTFLSLHGASGIPLVEVKQAIEDGGIVKVNINTELRVAFKDSLTEKLEEKPGEYRVYELNEDVILSVMAVVESKIDAVGSANKVPST